MYGERVFLARNEKKYKYFSLSKDKKNAQSTLEYALIFPVLFLMILAIFELALMWHQYYSLENATREISANIVLDDEYRCVNQEDALSIIKKKTAFLQEKNLSFDTNILNNIMTFTSNESYKGKPFVVVKIDCTLSGFNPGKYQPAAQVQLQAVHRLHFFAASLPNFRTGKRIVIIPDNVVLVSTKVATLSRN